ncbi:winged helix-turn-helix transcriptional regulator [Halobaculum sp. EA56]|uniref:winged helix-turn-helix transcriptional regulator n=1 Tax=Halobaculum sp. EA56 TaxID=3421648 RepID=UPI003EC0564F
MSEEAEPIDVWCAGEEWCPVTATATLIGRKWHPVIVHRLLEHGPCGFSELQEHVDGISSKVLSSTLEDLQEKRLVTREVISDKPFRVEYDLTDRGAALESVIAAMADWGERHLGPAEDEESALA